MRTILTLTLLAVLSTGCFETQRAAGCNNVGILGCKDEPSDIRPSQPELRTAPSAARSVPRADPYQQPPAMTNTDAVSGHQYPWTQPLNECMATGGLRSECFEKLPPEILAQFEAWEAERASIRRRQFERRHDPDGSSPFGMGSVEPES